MSDLRDDPSWNREARNVANALDHNDLQQAQEMMRRDLYQLQRDPRAQHEFINMVNNMDHKGIGADMIITRNQNGQEMWQIVPPNYGYERNYPVPPPQQIPPEVIVVQPQRESTGERFVNGLATGAGVGIGLGVMDRILGGGHHRR